MPHVMIHPADYGDLREAVDKAFELFPLLLLSGDVPGKGHYRALGRFPGPFQKTLDKIKGACY